MEAWFNFFSQAMDIIMLLQHIALNDSIALHCNATGQNRIISIWWLLKNACIYTAFAYQDVNQIGVSGSDVNN